MDPRTRAIVMMAVVGIVAGWLASVVVGGGGLIRYLITGVIGAFVGGFLFNFMGWKLGIGNALVEQILVSTIGAILVVLAARLIA